MSYSGPQTKVSRDVELSCYRFLMNVIRARATSFSSVTYDLKTEEYKQLVRVSFKRELTWLHVDVLSGEM